MAEIDAVHCLECNKATRDVRIKALGYRKINQISIGHLLPAGQTLKPTLCVSDTHLLPVRKTYGADSPTELQQLLEQVPDFQIFILGDFIESLPLSRKEIGQLERSPRIGALLDLLKFGFGTKLILGNHDIHVTSQLKNIFGSRVFPGGFRIGRLVFIHGHEIGLDASGFVERMPNVIAFGGALGRLGVGVPFGVATNEAVAAHYRVLGLYPIFGHTHVPVVSDAFANTGCFLSTYRSFITIENNLLALWDCENL